MARSVPRKQERRPAGTAADWEREELTRDSGKLSLSRPDVGGRGRRAARRPRRRSATVGWRTQPHPDDEAAPGAAGPPGRPEPDRRAERHEGGRSEEHRVGNAWGCTCESRWEA